MALNTFTLAYREIDEPMGDSTSISRYRGGTTQARSFNSNFPQNFSFQSAGLKTAQKDAYKAFWDQQLGRATPFNWNGIVVRFVSMAVSGNVDFWTVSWAFERDYTAS